MARHPPPLPPPPSPPASMRPPQSRLSPNVGIVPWILIFDPDNRQVMQPTTSRYPSGSFGIGVETEFLLEPCQRSFDGNTLREVVIKAASSYNEFLSRQNYKEHPAMHNAIDQAYHRPQYAEWSLDSDTTIETRNRNRAPYSPWRQHINLLWEFLSTNYKISANTSCGTHVNLSPAGGYILTDLKKICQSIIHFEPAFEALLPEDRLSNEYARSNWLDNSNFGYQNRTRKQSMDVIHEASTIRDLVLLMNLNHDKMFGWNFLYLLYSPHGTIQFRRGAASTSPQHVFMWIEVAMSFVQAAVDGGSRENLSRIPAAVGGLRWFIQAANLPDRVPGLYDSRYLDIFFARASTNAFREPRPLGKLSSTKLNKLLKKKEDKRKNIILAKVSHEPYWG
ncbi:hypothetical protein F5884DRAFT_831887 [Xylogone sp. PMI_703]|nr:hypothetical protein F5884DRAFT_831887 [Xylogone sp. PMI_703]